MSQPSTDPIRVLHVDDEPDFGEMAATFLEREHPRLSVETATGAEEGIDRLSEDDFDCIVSDYDMPGRDGIEFLETVRAEDPDVPFILFTGKGSEEIASDAISAGVTDYLQKENGTDQYALLANRIANAVDHYRSKRAAERSERRLRKIVDYVPHLLYVVDEDETYLLANETLAELHDTTVDALEGANVSDVLDEWEYEQFRGDLRTVLESGEPLRVSEVEVADAEGDRRVFEPRLYPYDLDDSDREAVLGTAIDVTEREERERELERQNERLEGFASIVSHDLRNPLSIADGRLELARSECDSDHLDAVARAHGRMERLIDDILTLAREGERIDATEPVALADAVGGGWRNVETANATLRVETERTVRTDPNRLRQLLENLFRNAVEHGGEGVTVEVGDLDDGFYVADDGPGIPEGERREVFDHGYSTSEVGTGFGLSIVREIVEAHGWDVRVVESDDGGARFEITGVDVESR